MTARLAMLILAPVSIGCETPVDPLPDPRQREEAFFRCLAAVPKGPERTEYNDWAEVVEECGEQAYWIATGYARAAVEKVPK